MNKYTPGPWRVTGCDIVGSGQQDVAVVAGPNRADLIPRREANKALIASAPELLEALENALNVLAGIATGDLEAVKRDSPAIAQARAAISKAKGEA